MESRVELSAVTLIDDERDQCSYEMSVLRLYVETNALKDRRRFMFQNVLGFSRRLVATSPGDSGGRRKDLAGIRC
jgi:hypothetical protein